MFELIKSFIGMTLLKKFIEWLRKLLNKDKKPKPPVDNDPPAPLKELSTWHEM